MKNKGHGKFSVVLLEIDMIGTKVTEDPKIKENVRNYAVKLKLKQNFVQDALNFMGLVSNSNVAFNVKNGKANFTSNVVDETQRFEVPIAEVENSKDFSVNIYADQIQKVFNVVIPKENSVILLKPEQPVIIMQDKRNVWALTPIVI